MFIPFVRTYTQCSIVKDDADTIMNTQTLFRRKKVLGFVYILNGTNINLKWGGGLPKAKNSVSDSRWLQYIDMQFSNFNIEYLCENVLACFYGAQGEFFFVKCRKSSETVPFRNGAASILIYCNGPVQAIAALLFFSVTKDLFFSFLSIFYDIHIYDIFAPRNAY